MKKKVSPAPKRPPAPAAPRAARALELEDVPVSDLHPFDQNPRTISDEAIDRIVLSIREFGFIQPVVAWRDPSDSLLKIVIGHQRYRAAIKAGLTAIPTAVRRLTREQAIALNIADNRLGELSSWDFPLLKDLLEEIDTGSLDLRTTGFTEDEIGGLMDWSRPLAEGTDAEATPPLPPSEIHGRTAAETPYMIVVFPDEETRAAFYGRIGAETRLRSVEWARIAPLVVSPAPDAVPAEAPAGGDGPDA